MCCSCCYSSNFSISIHYKDGQNLLFAAARSGNASLFLWLLDECKLQPVTDKVGFSWYSEWVIHPQLIRQTVYMPYYYETNSLVYLRYTSNPPSCNSAIRHSSVHQFALLYGLQLQIICQFLRSCLSVEKNSSKAF